MSEPNNGSSMALPRQSRTITGRTTHSISNQMVDQLISDVPLLTQDGGNSSDMPTISSLTKEERLSLSKEESMVKTETLLLKTRMVKFIKNGESSMLMNTRKSQPRDNSIRSSDFTLRETSMLSHNYQTIDIST
jgi:hypothetical protein